VSILPEPVIERDVVVRPDGRISVDLIGDVLASGKTTDEIAADIRDRISRFKRDAVVTVSVSAARSSTVTVFGQVVRPGSVILDRETRLAEAIGSTGGTNIFASNGRIRVVRHDRTGSKVLYVNLRDIQYGDQSTNYMLQDGDIVVVPPNAIARIGFALQNLLFPFQQVLSAGSGALLVTGTF
jgi:polysaccharide export outer membrane protein